MKEKKYLIGMGVGLVMAMAMETHCWAKNRVIGRDLLIPPANPNGNVGVGPLKEIKQKQALEQNEVNSFVAAAPAQTRRRSQAKRPSQTSQVLQMPNVVVTSAEGIDTSSITAKPMIEGDSGEVYIGQTGYIGSSTISTTTASGKKVVNSTTEYAISSKGVRRLTQTTVDPKSVKWPGGQPKEGVSTEIGILSDGSQSNLRISRDKIKFDENGNTISSTKDWEMELSGIDWFDRTTMENYAIEKENHRAADGKIKTLDGTEISVTIVSVKGTVAFYYAKDGDEMPENDQLVLVNFLSSGSGSGSQEDNSVSSIFQAESILVHKK